MQSKKQIKKTPTAHSAEPRPPAAVVAGRAGADGIDGTLDQGAGEDSLREHAERFHTVLTRALEVIGDRQETMRWLGTPVRALNYATPISLLDRPEGEQAVLAVLTRAEHGVF